MSEAGLRELRQNASELVRRAEAGERVVITVAGRPAAVLGPPPGSRAWRRSEDVAREVFAWPTDPSWPLDEEGVDQSVLDPWER